jgi:CheY-like chemotaxis protein
LTLFAKSVVARFRIVVDTATVTQLVTPGTLVMLVDDDPLVRESVAETLEIEGYTVAPVPTGEAALTALDLGATPSALLLDLWLPGMGSVAFLRALRARPGSRMPVIVLTAWPSTTRLDLNVDACLVKPAEATAIVRAVDRLVPSQRRRSPQRAARAGAVHLSVRQAT